MIRWMMFVGENWCLRVLKCLLTPLTSAPLLFSLSKSEYTCVQQAACLLVVVWTQHPVVICCSLCLRLQVNCTWNIQISSRNSNSEQWVVSPPYSPWITNVQTNLLSLCALLWHAVQRVQLPINYISSLFSALSFTSCEDEFAAEEMVEVDGFVSILTIPLLVEENLYVIRY